MLPRLQNGTFDVADRLFSSVRRSWDMCTSALSEVKELTPEWYTLPDFLTNANGFELGNAQVEKDVLGGEGWGCPVGVIILVACRSVGQSVCLSVGRSIRRSVGSLRAELQE